MSNKETLISSGEGKSIFLYTQGERLGKVQGSAEFVRYKSLAAAEADGVDVLDLVNAKLRAIAVNAAAGVSNTDGVVSLKSINAEIEDTALQMASGSLPLDAGQEKLKLLIARKAARKNK